MCKYKGLSIITFWGAYFWTVIPFKGYTYYTNVLGGSTERTRNEGGMEERKQSRWNNSNLFLLEEGN